MLDIVIYILLTIHLITSALLVLLVLLQRPRSEGLGAAFGSGVTESLFGAGTSDVLTKLTITLGSVFFALTLILAILYAHRTNDSITKKLLAQPTPIEETIEKTQPTTLPDPATTTTEAPAPETQAPTEETTPKP